MKKISAVLLALFVFSSTLVFAGPGSDHSHEPAAPISEDEALKTSADIVSNVVKEGKLDESWGTVKPGKPTQKTFQNQLEWVVAFNNPKVEDKNKQTLYVFMSLSGQYLGANFTGE